jgi:Cu(I)/Ag(I) efflux system membrane protein CusA/SilA
VGIKISGGDPKVIEEIGRKVEGILPELAETRSVFAERTSGGYYVDFDLKREQLARYGLSVDEAQAMVLNAIGGENVTTTIEGRERYPVNVRYMRDFRSSLDQLQRVLIPAMGGQQQIAMAQIADIKLVSGPSMLRDENGMLTGYVFIDVSTSDVGGYVEKARRLLDERVTRPIGYVLTWSGQYEAM